MPETTQYLNLGCGSRHHPAWINIDIAPNGPEVIQNDLSHGIPLPDSSCDVVYHAAVLEHLRRSDAAVFMTECCRVLKPGGIVRVGVPDLEKLCQLYLAKLAAALTGDKSASQDYDWVMLELFDQIVREKSGGGMQEYLRQKPLPNEAFVYERIGEEGRALVESLHNSSGRMQLADPPLPVFLFKLLRAIRTLPRLVKNGIQSCLLGEEDRHAIEIGRFRLAGEVHQWMYDRYSLARLLESSGFQDSQLCDATSSKIPNWASFHLDTLPNGQTVKPDLFFMEAIKSGASSND